MWFDVVLQCVCFCFVSVLRTVWARIVGSALCMYTTLCRGYQHNLHLFSWCTLSRAFVSVGNCRDDDFAKAWALGADFHDVKPWSICFWSFDISCTNCELWWYTRCFGLEYLRLAFDVKHLGCGSEFLTVLSICGSHPLSMYKQILSSCVCACLCLCVCVLRQLSWKNVVRGFEARKSLELHNHIN